MGAPSAFCSAGGCHGNPSQGIEMHECARVPARENAGLLAQAGAPKSPQDAVSQPRTVSAQLLQLQRTAGNRAVRNLIRPGPPLQAARMKSPAQRHAPHAGKSAPPFQGRAAAHDALPETVAVAPVAPLPGIAAQATRQPRIHRAWYNFDIPFTNYQFDPSIEGVKTAAGLVKDAAVSGIEWIVDEIKSAVSAGIDWLSGKWNSIQEIASSAFDTVKNAMSSIVGFIKNPLGFLADALVSFDAQSLSKAWGVFSGLVTQAANGFKALTDGLLGQLSRIWGGINGFATSLLTHVSSLTGNFLFQKLPDALQRIAFTFVDKLKSLWKKINDGWTALFNKFKAWVDSAIDSVFGFVRRVMSFGINVVIAGIVEFGKIVLFLKDLFTNPQKYVALLAERSVKAFDGVEARFAGLIGRYFGNAGAAPAVAASPTMKIHRAPAPAAAENKTSASWGEIGHGVSGMMGKKWAAFKANPMAVVTGLLMDMIFPIIGNVQDVIQLFKDIKKIVTGPLGAGSLEELWTSLLQILEIPILIYHTVVSILMRTLMLPLIVATFIPHPIVKGIAAAVGYGLLGAFLQAELLKISQSVLLLKTGKTLGTQKVDAYNSIADSLIALAMAAVITLVMFILHFIANVMKGVYSFIKGKVFGIEPAPLESKGTTPVDDGGASGKTKVVEVPSEDGQRRIRINEEGKCEVCASPCDDIRQKYASVMTDEIAAKIKAIEDDAALTDLDKERKLKPIEQELSDLANGKTPGASKGRVIKLDSPARIEATKPTQTNNIVNWRLIDSESKAEFSDVDVDVSDPANPGAPDQYLTPKTAKLPSGEVVKLEADFPFTDESLKKNLSVWEEYFKKPLTDYAGSLADENLGNFQAEFDRIRAADPSLTPQEVGNLAIREISFGRGRIRIGFGKLSVTIAGFEDVVIKMGPNKGKLVRNVPTDVKVSALRSVP